MASACFFIECPITKLILAVSRKNDPNAFGLPGGNVEPGENERCAALRGLWEETGIELYIETATGLWYPEIFRREGGVTFRGRVENIFKVGQLRAGETGRVAWVTPEQLMAGPFGDYNRRLLEHIGRVPKRVLLPTQHGSKLLDELMLTRLYAHKSNESRALSVNAYKALRDYVTELEARAGEIES